MTTSHVMRPPRSCRRRARRPPRTPASLIALLAGLVFATPAGAVGKATLATFAGEWYGHTRSLSVDTKGLVREFIGSGCCDPIVRLRLHLYSPRGSATRASVKAYVSWVRILDRRAFNSSFPAPRVGQKVTWRLQNGVLTEPATNITYCDPNADEKGRCGA